ncbi:TPA_asm: polyprotein P2 [Prunus mira virus A]
MDPFAGFSMCARMVHTRLACQLGSEPGRRLSSPLFPELSKLLIEQQMEVLVTFDLPLNGMVTPGVVEQLQDAEDELVAARRRLMVERLESMQSATRCPTLGECIYYDAPGVDQETAELQDALEAPTPDWWLEKIRPLWPKDDYFRDCLAGPYPEDYGDIPLGCFDELFAAFDAMVEEHWESVYSTHFESLFGDSFYEEEPYDMFEMCVNSAGSLIPACMMADSHIQPTGHRADDASARQDFADSSDSLQSMGDFWKSFYAKESGKKIKDSHISRIADNPNKVGFTKSAIFHKVPLSEQMANSWSRMRGKEDKESAVKVTMELNVQKYTVRMPDAVRTSEGPLFIEWINLPRMTEEGARKIAEAGWNNANICGVDLGIKSHVAVGTQVRAIISVIDGACTDLPTATMCAFEINLASQNNRSLNLPLINLPFSSLLNDMHYFQNRIKIACQFRDPEGFSPSTPMFSFSSLEFSEMTQTAFERESLLRDSWSEIEKRACHGGGRCVASQGVVQTWEKEVNPPLKEYPALVLPPPPAPMRNFIDAQSGQVVKNAISKSRSMRYQSPHELWARPSVDGGSTSAKPPGDNLRCSNVPGCAYEVDPLHLLYYEVLTIPKDALEGTLIKRFDIRKQGAALDSPVWRNWVKDGAMKPKIQIKITMAGSVFSGISVGCAFDAYRRVDPKLTTGLSATLLMGLPGKIWHMRESEEVTWELDLSQVCGHTFYALDDSLAAMDFLFYIARGNELTSAADWQVYVAFYVDWSQESFETTLAPTLTWPPQPTLASTFSELRGPYSFDLAGTNKSVDIGFLPGTSVSIGGKVVRTFNRVVAAHYRSWTGKIRMSIELASSIFITGSFCVGVDWNAKPDFDDMLKKKHWIVKPGEIFDLDLYGPYGENPTAAGQFTGKPHLAVFLLGGIVAPKDSVGSLGFFVRIHELTGIYKNPVLRTDRTDRGIAWFRVTNIQDDNLVFNVPGQIVDLTGVSGSHDITNYANPTSLLFSVTGMHGGVIRLYVTWSPVGKLGDCDASIKYMQFLWHTPTENYYGDQGTRGLIDMNGFSVDVRCGTFFGATKPNDALDVERVAFYLTNGKKIHEIRVSYEILSMEFYGRTTYIR